MIKFLITTAITYPDHHKYGNADLIKKREKQYIDFIDFMKTIKIDQYYCECVSTGPYTFLNDKISQQNLFYSNTHNQNLKNIGVDEINACKAALDYFKFDDDDMIIKLTGRYMLNSMMFINEIIEHENDFDVFYHPFPTNHSGNGQMFTGAFGIRKIHWQSYLERANIEKMERKMINVERDMLNYLDANRDKIRLMPFNKLDLSVYPGDGGEVWQV